MDIWKDHSQEAKKERWKALWAMEDLPRPLWFIPATPVLAVAASWLVKKRSVTGLFMDRDVQLEQSLKFNRFFGLAQRWWSQDDFVLHLQPQMGVGVFASAFGCEVQFPLDQMPWSRAFIKHGDPPEKVYELEEPEADAGLLGLVLEFTEHFEKKAGGKYPMAMTDLQGPMDTAYLVWDSIDFMVAMYDNPREVHHLMRMVTDLIVKFVKKQRELSREFVPAHFPPVYLPDGGGVVVSEDALAVLSPHLYEEFSLPYINELSEEFGGIVIHSCGNFEHQLPVLQKVHNLKGINFGVTETRFEAVWDAFGGKTCVIPHCSAETIVADFRNAAEWISHVMRRKTTNRGLALMVVPAVGDAHQITLDVALGRKTNINMKELALMGRNVRRLVEGRA